MGLLAARHCSSLNYLIFFLLSWAELDVQLALLFVGRSAEKDLYYEKKNASAIELIKRTEGTSVK